MVMSQELHSVKTRVVSIATDVGLYLHIFGWNSPQLQELEFKVNKKRIIMLVGFLSFQLRVSKPNRNAMHVSTYNDGF